MKYITIILNIILFTVCPSNGQVSEILKDVKSNQGYANIKNIKEILQSINDENDIDYIVYKMNLNRYVKDSKTGNIVENYERSFYSILLNNISNRINTEKLNMYFESLNDNGKVSIFGILITRYKEIKDISDKINKLLINKNFSDVSNVYVKGYKHRICDIIYNIIIYEMNKNKENNCNRIDKYDDYNERDSKINKLLKIIGKNSK